MNDLRFPTALQIVLSLAVAAESDRRCTSGELAAALGTNPALVRALLVPLARAGIIATTTGKLGGVTLAKAPSAISLRDVYLAVIDDKHLFEARANIREVCVVSRNIGSHFKTLAKEAEDAMLMSLGARTVAGSLQEIRTLDDRHDSKHRGGALDETT